MSYIASGKIVLPLSIVSSSPEETFALGERLAALLGRGSVIALEGPIGAGKTCLTKGLAKGLGVAEEVTSPSYTIISEYEAFPYGENTASINLYHIDAYRLGGNDDFFNIGGEEIVFGNGISVIEWSGRIGDSIPNDAFRVEIQILDDGKRKIVISRSIPKESLT